MLGLAACGGGQSSDGAAPSTTRVIVASGQTVIPSDTLQDWVSYGDSAVAFTVMSEKQDPYDESVKANKEGLVGRTVVLKVTKTYWTRANVAAPPAQFSVQADGWGLKDGKLIPMRTADGPRLTVGHTYVGLIADLLGSRTPVPGAVAEVVDGKVSIEAQASASSWARELNGHAVADVAARLKETEADPLATKYADLDAAERYQAVLRARGGSAQTATMTSG